MYEISKTLNMMQNYKAILTRFVNSKSANFITPFTCINKNNFYYNVRQQILWVEVVPCIFSTFFALVLQLLSKMLCRCNCLHSCNELHWYLYWYVSYCMYSRVASRSCPVELILNAVYGCSGWSLLSPHSQLPSRIKVSWQSHYRLWH